MKLARLSVLVLAIVTSMLAVPDAIGKGKKGGALGTNGQNDCDYYIYCYYTPIQACCYGSFEYCYSECVNLCGGPCDSAT